jgi:tetratricopeptide (TPR) repeat protein
VKPDKDHEDYINEARWLLKTFRGKAALHVIQDGLEKFPADPLLLSFNGFLTAQVEKKYNNGIKICMAAISSPDSQSIYTGALYLNLGKAYTAAGRKAEAVEAFKKGIEAEPENRDIQWEIKKLGTRKKPVIPFLNRSNPVNKYLGRLRSKLSR